MDGKQLQDLAGIGLNFTAESGGWSKPAGHPPNPDRARREAALKDDYLKMMKREIYKIYHKIFKQGCPETWVK